MQRKSKLRSKMIWKIAITAASKQNGKWKTISTKWNYTGTAFNHRLWWFTLFYPLNTSLWNFALWFRNLETNQGSILSLNSDIIKPKQENTFTIGFFHMHCAFMNYIWWDGRKIKMLCVRLDGMGKTKKITLQRKEKEKIRKKHRSHKDLNIKGNPSCSNGCQPMKIVLNGQQRFECIFFFSHRSLSDFFFLSFILFSFFLFLFSFRCFTFFVCSVSIFCNGSETWIFLYLSLVCVLHLFVRLFVRLFVCYAQYAAHNLQEWSIINYDGTIETDRDDRSVSNNDLYFNGMSQISHCI